MEIQEILEYNKRCTEFLGWRKTHPNIKNWHIYVTPIGHVGYDKMLFHSDWNWIHEIIQKINNSPITVPMNGIDSIIPYIEARRPIIKGLINNNKETVVETINQFLIWYNEQK